MGNNLREIDILNYLPPVVRDTAEFQQIAEAENPEFNNFLSCIYQALQDSFVQDASEYGVKRWEAILSITPAEGATLDERKAAILAYLSVKLPYTWRVLERMLIGILGDKFVMYLNNDMQELNITFSTPVSETPIDVVQQLMERVLPRNLTLKYDYDIIALTKIVEERLYEMLGEGNFTLKLNNDTSTLTVAVALDTTESQFADVQTLLDRVLPRNLVTEMEWAAGLPIDYTPLEYIESTGTQYIDTGILPKGSYKVSFSILSRVWDGYSNSNPVFFSFEGGKWYFYSLNWQGIYASAGQRGYGSQRYSLAYPPMHELNVRYDVVLDGGKTIRNGVELGSIGGTFEYEDFEFSRISILLLNRTDVKTQPTSKVLYNFSIDDNGIPVVNYIPALNPEGQPGLYDTVSKVFKTNIGTGDFLYPGKETEATTYSLRNRMYAKLTEHGVRRLYRVPAGYNGGKEEYAEENGFKILVETPMPEEGYWAPVWHDREDCIELEWIETEPPTEEVTENE